MSKKQSCAERLHLVACMQEGQSWRVATEKTGIQISQSTAYRLCKSVRQHGESALQDGRHGYPSKLRGAARAFLEEQCQHAPHTPGSTLQAQLRERFDLKVSISQINRVRAALGLSHHPMSQKQEKKRK